MRYRAISILPRDSIRPSGEFVALGRAISMKSPTPQGGHNVDSSFSSRVEPGFAVHGYLIRESMRADSAARL